MEPGLVVAHIVMLLMAPLLAAFVGYCICHGRERQYARRIRREAPAYAPGAAQTGSVAPMSW